MTSPTAEPDGMKHFVSPGGSLEFDYPEGWVEDPGTTDVGGTFYSRDHPDEKRQPGDMKLEFAIHENSEKDDLSDIEARECTREPALEAAVQCERREINGRTWVWQAVQTTDYFDRSYVLSIQTIVKDRIYSLAGYILRGEDVSDERIQILEKILLTAKANG